MSTLLPLESSWSRQVWYLLSLSLNLELVLRDLREVGFGITLSLVQLLVPLTLLKPVVVLVVPESVLALVPEVVVVLRPRQASHLIHDVIDLQQ